MTPLPSRATWTPAPRNNESTHPDGVMVDPLAGLSDSERVELAIKFGRIRMCAALTHGHSFESSVFKLPGKCSACHEMVWGPFTRGCTCLTCRLTAHRSCTGVKTMPPCPTKAFFDDFCRSELAKRSRDDSAQCSSEQQQIEKMSISTHGRPADLDEWATVEGSSNIAGSGIANQEAELPSPSSRQPSPPSSPELVKPVAPQQEVRNLGSSFSWSPFGILGDRKRLQSPKPEPKPEYHSCATNIRSDEGHNERLKCAGESVVSTTAADQLLLSPKKLSTEKEGTRDSPVSGAAAGKSVSGLTSFGKISVAGGVVGAVLGGPAGAVAGLKLGVFVAAGRWTVQEKLWQRIKQERTEAGAEAIGLRRREELKNTVAGDSIRGDEAIRFETSDIWALIAQGVEEDEKRSEWELDSTEIEHLELGDTEAEKVVLSVVEQILGNETATPCRLLHALLSEFRARHRVCKCGRTDKRPPCECPRAKARRPRDDMVSVFPRAGDRRQSAPPAPSEDNTESDTDGLGIPPDSNDDQNEGPRFSSFSSFSGRAAGLEKTFSFVEETETVAGEGSDAPAADEGDSGMDEEEDEERDEEVSTRADSGSNELLQAPASVPVPVEASRATESRNLLPGTASRRDLFKNNASHLDSWVELEGIGCNSCGGRIVSEHGQGRNANLPPEDMEEDDGGFGESWAAAEAPPCGCADELGLSASPESIQSITLHGLKGDRSSGEGDDKQGAELRSESIRGCGEWERDTVRGVQLGEEMRSMDAASTSRTQVVDSGLCVAQGDVREDDRDQGCEERKDTEPGKETQETYDALRDVHGVLRELTRAVLAWCPALTASDSATIHAVNCIDRRVFAVTYRAVFSRVAAGQARQRDAALTRRVQEDAFARAAAARPSLAASCQPRALGALRSARRARTGLDKLASLLQAVEAISESLPPRSTTDTLLWSLCRHLAAATTATADDLQGIIERPNCPALPRPHAEVAFVEQFMRDESWLMGKEGYALTTVDAALHVLLNPAMSDEVFLDANTEEAYAS